MAKQTAEPPPPSRLAPNVPDDLDALCVDLLRRRPEDRPDRRRGAPAARARRRRAAVAAGLAGAGRSSAARGSSRLLREAFGVARPRARRSRRSSTAARGWARRRCVQRFLDELADRGEAVVLAGRCYEQESVAYKALDTLIDALSRYLRRLGRHEADAPDAPRRGRPGAGLPRPPAGRGRGRGAAARRSRSPTSRSSAAAPSPPCARCSCGSATAARWSWPSTTSSGATSTAPRCWPTCSARPTRRVLLLLCSYRSEDAAGSPCLRVAPRGGRRPSPCSATAARCWSSR